MLLPICIFSHNILHTNLLSTTKPVLDATCIVFDLTEALITDEVERASAVTDGDRVTASFGLTPPVSAGTFKQKQLFIIPLYPGLVTTQIAKSNDDRGIPPSAAATGFHLHCTVLSLCTRSNGVD